MLVRFTTNVGSNDAEPLGIDFRNCTKDAECQVSDSIGLALVRRRLAVQVAEIKAVASKPTIAAVPEPAIAEGSVEKATEDLKSYRARASHQAPSIRKE